MKNMSLEQCFPNYSHEADPWTIKTWSMRIGGFSGQMVWGLPISTIPLNAVRSLAEVKSVR